MPQLDSDTLSLLIAISSDERKAARLTELYDAEMKLNEARDNLEKVKSENQDVLAQAISERMRTANALDELGRGKIALDEEKKAFNRINDQLTQEKAAWEAMRAEVNAQMGAQHTELDARAEALQQRENMVTAREAAVADANIAASAMHNAAQAKISRLRAALEEVDPCPVGIESPSPA